jgi:hypothetical protein
MLPLREKTANFKSFGITGRLIKTLLYSSAKIKGTQGIQNKSESARLQGNHRY